MNKNESTCLFCKTNKVEIKRWNLPCKECKAKTKTIKNEVAVGQRQPAAIIEGPNGETVYVDKFGNKTDNPGYDIQNDKRGWKHTGAEKKKSIII